MSRPASDSESEADDLESLIHSLSIRVEYYRYDPHETKENQPMTPVNYDVYNV